MTRPVSILDALKLLRSGWISRPELARKLGVHAETVKAWIAALEEAGMVRVAQGKCGARGGKPPLVFALTWEWGGVAR